MQLIFTLFHTHKMSTKSTSLLESRYTFSLLSARMLAVIKVFLIICTAVSHF